MTNKKIFKYQIFSFVFVSILGVLFHYIYEWSNYNTIVSLIAPVNESTWEHLKLLFYPMTISTIIGYFYIGKNKENFFCANIIGIVVAMLFTIVFFYTYTGILGKNIDIINIATFFIATFIGEYITYRILILDNECLNKENSILIWGIITFCYILFTYYTPKIGLFKDPITNKYGIINNK